MMKTLVEYIHTHTSNLKTEKGITLIALVITIIVLLILAGVTVATLTGENGLLSKAQFAKERNIEAEQDEKDKLESYENELSNYGTWERTGGTSNVNSIINLSENETTTNQTLNGKTIYTKGFNIQLGASNDEHFDTNIQNIETLWIDIQNSMFLGTTTNISNYSGYGMVPCWYIDSTDWIRVGADEGKIRVGHASSFNGRYVYITIRYTKTETSTE